MPKFKGEWRIRGANGTPNRVQVTDGDMSWDDIEEMEYRRSCYQPPFDDLPWSINDKTPTELPKSQSEND